MSKDFRVFVKKNSLVDDEPFVDDEPEVGSDVISDSSEDERGNDYDFEDGFLIADEDTENKTATDNDVIEFEKRRAKIFNRKRYVGAILVMASILLTKIFIYSNLL